MRSVVLCVLFVCAFGDELPSRLVNIAQGPVRGYKDPDHGLYVFYNVPYAMAPTGRNRFKAPGPPPVWDEPYEAVDKNIVCPQSNYMVLENDMINVQEDCLVANIHATDTEDDMLPVVLYVHGGAYMVGYGNMIDPKKVVNSKKMLVVTFNYRLAGHGFLCLGTEDTPGNAGMKDQVAMLRWVKNNIASFGGNPNDITLAGGSAGSSSVDLLMISKITKGLFNKVIPESGANTAAFSVQTDPIRAAKEYAQLLNYDGSDDIYDLEEFFKTIPVDRLNSINTFQRTDATFIMSPCVERDIGEEMFLHDGPVNILQSGDYEKVPMLYGFANMEGLVRIMFIAGDVKSDLERMESNFSNYLPADLYFTTAEEREEVAKRIKTFFFGNKVDEDDILDHVNYFSDVYFTYSTLRSVRLQVEAGNDQIYLYEYSFTDENTPFVPFTKVRGANHCAQSMAIWDINSEFYRNMNVTKEFQELKNNLREVWIHFINTGTPIPDESNLPEWPPVGRKWSPHMSIGKALELRGSLLKERTLFWEEIYAKHYRAPQPPPTPPPKRVEL